MVGTPTPILSLSAFRRTISLGRSLRWKEESGPITGVQATTPSQAEQGVRVLVCQAAVAGQTPAWEALLRDPFPSPATTGNRSGNPPHKFFELHLETSRAICSAGQTPGFLVHQKCHVCLFF